MLKAGVHFGHVSSKRHPKMAPFIFGVRSNVHIIDLEITLKYLEKAFLFAREVARQGGDVLFVATKKQAQKLVKEAAESCGMPYMVDRWIGGLLTNFNEINKVIKRYHSLKNDFESGKLDTYTKKEKLCFERELAKLEAMIGGVKNLKKLPEALFVVDIKKEHTAIAEANKINMPIIAVVDTNVNPELVTHPIPANDDAIRSISLISSLIAEAINEGKSELTEGDKEGDEKTSVETQETEELP